MNYAEDDIPCNSYDHEAGYCTKHTREITHRSATNDNASRGRVLCFCMCEYIFIYIYIYMCVCVFAYRILDQVSLLTVAAQQRAIRGRRACQGNAFVYRV